MSNREPKRAARPERNLSRKSIVCQNSQGVASRQDGLMLESRDVSFRGGQQGFVLPRRICYTAAIRGRRRPER